MWVQKLPPEGGACFSAASEPVLLEGDEAKARRAAQTGRYLVPPWESQGPRVTRGERRQDPGFQEESVRGAQGKRKARPGACKGSGSSPSLLAQMVSLRSEGCSYQPQVTQQGEA